MEQLIVDIVEAEMAQAHKNYQTTKANLEQAKQQNASNEDILLLEHSLQYWLGSYDSLRYVESLILAPRQ